MIFLKHHFQASHVGVGISGREGLQAACASDYAIGQVGDQSTSFSSCWSQIDCNSKFILLYD